jgi:hypothetical protein
LRFLPAKLEDYFHIVIIETDLIMSFLVDYKKKHKKPFSSVPSVTMQKFLIVNTLARADDGADGADEKFGNSEKSYFAEHSDKAHTHWNRNAISMESQHDFNETYFVISMKTQRNLNEPPA